MSSRHIEAERALLDSFAWLPFRAATDFDGAVQISRTCRANGVTPRGLVDCMIAEVMDLRLDPASVVP